MELCWLCRRLKSTMKAMEIGEVSFDDLKSYTDNFSQHNFIGNFQFGKVYRGKIGDHDVTVKAWMPQTLYICYPGDNENRLEDELLLHTDSRIKSHPNVAKLIGYCREGQLAVVYDLNPVDTLHSFMLRDDFSWLQRVKIALQLACLLQFLHTPCLPYNKPYIVCNIDAAHFVLDKDYNLVLYDFGMFTGGLLPQRDDRRFPSLCGCHGYSDPHINWGRWCGAADVFAFGCILAYLITKTVFRVEDYTVKHGSIYGDKLLVDEWAAEEYERRTTILGDKVALVDESLDYKYYHDERRIKLGDKVSLFHESLEADPDFTSADGFEATTVAMRCLVCKIGQRMEINEVVEHLLKLDVFRDTLNHWVSADIH